MTQEDKELLLKDLCARLPYGVIISRGQYDKNPIKINSISITSIGIFFNGYFTEGIHFTFDGKGDIWPKPYLRPMSSMTEEEKKEYNDIVKNTIDFYNCPKSEEICFFIIPIEWLNAHHFDYHRLILKGLALEALEGMYNIKKK